MRSPCTQAGLCGVINAAGRLVQRGALPSLRCLTVTGPKPAALAPLPRPEAAPHVETRPLSCRMPPIWRLIATNDILPDMRLALGLPEDWGEQS